MARKGKKGKSGWHGESRRHGLARMGVSTVLPDGRRLAVNKFVAGGKFQEIMEGHGWIDDPNWYSEIDGKKVKLGVIFEALDWREYDRDAVVKKDGVEYPVSLFASIMVQPEDVDKSYAKDVIESAGVDEFDVYDMYTYGGGVATTDILENTKLSGEKLPKIDSVVEDYGGIGNSGEVRHFKNVDDAMLWAEKVYAPRVEGSMVMIGFTLDRPVNRIGNTGWDTIGKQALGKDW